VIGRKGLIVDKVEDVDRPALVARIVEQLYADASGPDVPKEIFVPDLPEDIELYEQFLSLNRGSKVRIRVPQRGSKRELLATAQINAKESFARHKLRRASDHNARARALLALQDALGLPEAPLRIECFDISNLQGTEIVGSMVVMEDGLPKRSDYRRFKVRGLEGQDDFASMEDVLTRRFRNYLRERDEGAQTGKRFAYPPNLLLIDGGKGQLNVAVRVLEELGLEDICVASLAKRFEEVYLPGENEPVRIPRDSEALYLLQQVRDEAHRFAITYHRQLRDKKMTTSVLDNIPGLGPTRRKRLLKEFGSVKKLRELDEADLLALPWLPEAVARATYAQLHGVDRASMKPS
jgi:excinuclease ABC subunit C